MGLAKEIKVRNIGIKFGDQLLSILLYAHDNVIYAQNESDLQKLLDIICSWCMKWRPDINNDKTQMMHVRKPSERKSSIYYRYGPPTERKSILNYTSIYDHMNSGRLANDLAKCTSRALG